MFPILPVQRYTERKGFIGLTRMVPPFYKRCHKLKQPTNTSQREMKVDFQNTEIAFERKSNKELKRMKWLFRLMSKNFLVSIGGKITLLALRLRLPIKGLIKMTIFPQFCGGTSLEASESTIFELAQYNVATILDYGAEGKETEADFDRSMKQTIKSIEFASTNTMVPVVSCKITGLTRFALLEKMHRGDTLSESEQAEAERSLNRLNKICEAAHHNRMGVFIDAEESWIQGPIDDWVDLMMQRYNMDYPSVYNTFQLYLKDRYAFLEASYEKAQQRGYILGAKLVRGAYMEKERERAEEMGYPNPIQPSKAACDTDYNKAVEFCLPRYESIASCLASHNEYSTRLQLQLINSLGIPPKHPHINFCQLYGMSDNLTFNLAKAGYTVAKYMPYGPVKDVIPYLIRRAEENSAVGGEVGRELQLIQAELKRRKTL